MTSGYNCKVCERDALEEVEAYARLHRVTSDSKSWPSGGQLTCCRHCGAVQKLPSIAWQSEIHNIYDAFELYHQADGAEQPIFDSSGGTSAPRSVKIVDHIQAALKLGGAGSLLDFGCGNGAALASFARRKPQWDLFGAELNDRALPRLQQIPNFVELYTCAPDEIARTFDLVTLIHALEHVVDPIATLANLRSRVGPRGHIVVEVPDCVTTPYDLLVADHLMHFSLRSLETAGEKAGFETVSLSNSVLTKELTWIGRGGEDGPASIGNVATDEAEPSLERVRVQVNWLLEQIDAAGAIAQTSETFGIFGTSISATWLQGALGDMAEFFVDEDPARVNRQHMGRPIFAPDAVPEGADVYVPLIPSVARSITGRLDACNIVYHAPPALRPNIG